MNVNFSKLKRCAQVFNVAPLTGKLAPAESQQVAITFHGGAWAQGRAVAQCRVEEGPVYHVTLRGAASHISYSLSSAHLDMGLTVYTEYAGQPSNYETRSISLVNYECSTTALFLSLCIPQRYIAVSFNKCPECKCQCQCK